MLKYDLIKDGASLLEFKSMVEMGRKYDATVTSQPVEEGSFNSINKVVKPQSFTVRLGFQGSSASIVRCIAILEAELCTASVLQIVSPLGVTPKGSLTAFTYRQNLETGNGGLQVELTFEEIKEVKKAYTNTDIPPVKAKQAKNASDVSNVDSGKQQAKTPSQSLLRKLTS